MQGLTCKVGGMSNPFQDKPVDSPSPKKKKKKKTFNKDIKPVKNLELEEGKLHFRDTIRDSIQSVQDKNGITDATLMERLGGITKRKLEKIKSIPRDMKLNELVKLVCACDCSIKIEL